MRARIVIVDDEPDVAELFRQQFRKELRVALRHGAHGGLQRVSAPEVNVAPGHASPSWVYAS